VQLKKAIMENLNSLGQIMSAPLETEVDDRSEVIVAMDLAQQMTLEPESIEQ
jgi:hypothetical protein